MANQITDLVDRVTDSTTGRPVISSLAAPGKAIGAASISLTDATNWSTSAAIHFSIYQVNAAGYKDPTTQTDWKGTLSGTTISNLTLTGGTDRAYNTGDKVELGPTARYAKDLYDWGTAHANQDGSLKTTAVQAALNISTTASADWTPLATVPTVVSSNGQREHQIQFTGVNYTDRLQAGTKFQIPRTSTVPTQSAQFVAASSQYASKTSPTGFTFTDDFTAEAWIYMTSYNAVDSPIVSNSTNAQGWHFSVTNTGQVQLSGHNGTTANSRRVVSYQSVPLNKWVHVAATLDMSGFTTATNQVWFDGVSVPVNLNSVGTNPTSLNQTGGTLAIGHYDFGVVPSGLYDGRISHVRVWSTQRTTQQIRDNANKLLVGNETGLVGYWKLNGTFADSTANANTLTAVAGAIATYTDSPFKATEYAIVTGLNYTGGNTVATIFTGSNTLPNETLGSINYSSARAPFGFPSNRELWSVITLMSGWGNVVAANTYTLSNYSLAIPTGEWSYGYETNFEIDGSVAGAAAGRIMLNTTAMADLRMASKISNQAANSYFGTMAKRESSVSLNSLTTYNLYALIETAGGTGTIYVATGSSFGCISAKCAYL